MKTLRLSVIPLAAALIVGVGWFALRHYQKHLDCLRRNAAFDKRIESIKQDARDELKIGAKKPEVSEFFIRHNMSFAIAESEAIGTLYTVGGCAPLGCGTDRALVGVRVKVDAEGTITGEPYVGGMYVDCV